MLDVISPMVDGKVTEVKHYDLITSVHNNLTAVLLPNDTVVAAYVEDSVELWKVEQGDKGLAQLKSYYLDQEFDNVCYTVLRVVE